MLIDLIHKCQNAPVPHPTMNGALWDVEQVHSGICEIGLLKWQVDHIFFTGELQYSRVVL